MSGSGTLFHFTCDNPLFAVKSIYESPSFHARYLLSSIVRNQLSLKAFARGASIASLCIIYCSF
jgi:hypothetical protein